MIFNKLLTQTVEKMNEDSNNELSLVNVLSILITLWAMYQAYKCSGNKYFTFEMAAAFLLSPLYLIYLWGKKNGPCLA